MKNRKKIKMNWKKLGLIGIAGITVTAASLTPVYINQINNRSINNKSSSLNKIDKEEINTNVLEIMNNLNLSEISGETTLSEQDLSNIAVVTNNIFSKVEKMNEFNLENLENLIKEYNPEFSMDSIIRENEIYKQHFTRNFNINLNSLQRSSNSDGKYSEELGKLIKELEIARLAIVALSIASGITAAILWGLAGWTLGATIFPALIASAISAATFIVAESIGIAINYYKNEKIFDFVDFVDLVLQIVASIPIIGAAAGLFEFTQVLLAIVDFTETIDSVQ